MKRNLFFLIAAFLMLSACSKDDDLLKVKEPECKGRTSKYLEAAKQRLPEVKLLMNAITTRSRGGIQGDLEIADWLEIPMGICVEGGDSDAISISSLRPRLTRFVKSGVAYPGAIFYL